MHCSQCGEEAPDTNCFCCRCGAPLAAGTVDRPVVPPAGPRSSRGPAAPRYRDLSTVARAVVVLIWAYLGAVLVNLAVSLKVGDARPGSNCLSIVDLAYLAASCALAAAGVVFLVWTYLANRNCRAMGAGLEFPASYAVAFHFLPVLSWYRPYHAMREIWKASIDAGRWRAQPTPGLLRAWWALWLLHQCVDWCRARAVSDVNARQVDLSILDVALVVSTVLVCPFAIRIVHTITRNQAAQAVRTGGAV